MGRFAGELTKHLRKDFADTMKLLRDPEFQQLLTDYPRAKRQFIIAHETQDTVSSRIEERYGQQPSAEDYLAAFSAFVRNKADEIEALRILISRPEGWNPDALHRRCAHELARKWLRRKNAPPRARGVHRKALADIISMVKHAAREAEPLLTAEERVAAVHRRNPGLSHLHPRTIAVARPHRPPPRRESLHRHRGPQDAARLHQKRRAWPRPQSFRRSAPAAHRAAELFACRMSENL